MQQLANACHIYMKDQGTSASQPIDLVMWHPLHYLYSRTYGQNMDVLFVLIPLLILLHITLVPTITEFGIRSTHLQNSC